MKESIERTICMCKVYEFPAKVQLTKELEERLQKLAEDYIKEINNLVVDLEKQCSNEKELEELMELVFNTYAAELMKYIDNV